VGYDIEIDRDRPLSFDWHAPNIWRIIGLTSARNAALERSMASVLACAILAVESGQRVSYSRRKEFYSNSSRYRGTSFTYTTVLSSIAALNAAGLIIDARARPGNLGRQSIFVASDELIDACDDDDLSGQLAHDPGEIIRLKDSAGELVDYRDTRDTRRMRRSLAETNEHLATLRIGVPGAERRGHHMVFKDKDDEDYFVLPKPGNGLYRVFSRGSFAQHGRAYGWWQNIPKTARQSLTVNDEPTVEADYRSLHPTILYNEAGIRFCGDAYDVDGFERRDVKLGFNIAINAKDKRTAVWALAYGFARRRADNDNDIVVTVADRQHAANVITAIKRRHKPIERHFCSDAGVRLMRIDSELILGALRAMNDNGDAALPVHDALIVPARCATQATAKMVESFEKIVGRANPCSVSIKGGSDPHMVLSPPLSSPSGPRPGLCAPW
jgi:hypothetical protein